MVVDVINNTEKNIKKFKPITINDIYNHNQLIVDFSPKMKKVDKQIKSFLNKNMYNHKKVKTNTNKAKKIIKGLFEYLLKNPKNYINILALEKKQKERSIADFISGMTDRYAINLYNKKIK